MKSFRIVRSAPVVALALSMAAGNIATANAPRGAVYVMSNATAGNKVLIFSRQTNGSLKKTAAVSTQGTGTASSLGNQGGLILDEAKRCLFAVNAGSDTVSSFRVTPGGLKFAQKISSGGARPVSLSAFKNYLYVLNAGGTVGKKDNIYGLTFTRNCGMRALGARQPLSADNTAPAQVQFSPDGQFLVVTEKATNKINTYKVGKDGKAGAPNVQPSVGTTPFGFSFGQRFQLHVSEAAAGAPNQGYVTSYLLKPDGKLRPITRSLPMRQTATCWVVISNDGRFAYVSNTGSSSLSSLNVGFGGSLKLQKSVAGTTGNNTTPIDIGLSPDGLNLYSLDNTLGSIAAFKVDPISGSIAKLPLLKGLPAGANGVAVR